MIAVMRLSPNPVFKAVSWVYLWIFRGTPVYVQLVFWGLFPTIYQRIQLGVPFGPSFFHLDLRDLSISFLPAIIGLGLNEAAYMAEIIEPGSTRFPKGNPGVDSAGHVVVDDDAAHRASRKAMRVIIPPTGNEFISMLKTTSLVTAVPHTRVVHPHA